jgi:hypothetical protein
MCGPIKLGGLCNVYVRELFQKSGVIDVVAKYGEPRVAEIEVRAVRRRRSCQQVTTGSSSLVRLSNMVEGMPAGAKFYILVASAKTANHSIFSCCDRVQLPPFFCTL